MSIRLWDFGCECGKVYRDFPCANRIYKTIACECGKRAGWISQGINGLTGPTSSMYPRFEPGLGVTVESYGHKQKLMRAMGVQDSSDPTKGSRNYRPEEPESSGVVSNNTQFLDAKDMEQAQAEALSRAAQGDFDLEI